MGEGGEQRSQEGEENHQEDLGRGPNQRMDQVEEKSKKTLRDLRERLKKAYKSMRDEFAEITEEDILEPIE